MSLQDLQTALQNQVDQAGRITVSEDTIKQAQLTPVGGFDTLIQSNLMIEDALFVNTQTIPDPQGNQLSLSGAASFLGLTDIDIDLTFTLSQETKADVLISVSLGDNWKFSDSFEWGLYTKVDRRRGNCEREDSSNSNT